MVVPLSAGATGLELGKRVPNFILSSLDGKTVALSDFRRKHVMFLYWRPGQKRSLDALRDFKVLYEKFQSKGVEAVSFVPDSDLDKVNEIVNALEINFPVIRDISRKVFGDYGIRVYPTTLLIDGQRNLAFELPGHAVTFRKVLQLHLRRLLGELDEAGLRDSLGEIKGVKDSDTLSAERKYNLALQMTEAQLFDQAVEAAKGSLESKPDIVKTHILLGFLYLEQKEPELAAREFQRALELEPNSHDAETGLGGAMILQGDIDGAIEILNKATIANPYPQMTYFNLGLAYEQKGDKEMAITMFKKSLEKLIHKKILPSSLSRCK